MVGQWLREGLSKSTTDRHKKGWALWVDHVNAENHLDNVYLDRVGTQEKIKMLVLFIRGVCLGSHGNKSAVESAMAAVHSGFTQTGRCGAIFLGDAIKLARKSGVKKTVAGEDYAVRNDKKLPAAYEMMSWLRKRYWVGKDWATEVDSRMTYIGSAVALDCLLRVSEYAHVADTDYMIRCRDVAFELEGSSVTYQPGQLGKACTQFGTAVRRVQVHIPKFRSKVANSERKIFINWRGPESEEGAQLVRDLTEFCVREGGVGDTPLFSRVRKGRRKHLNYDMVVTGVKAAATACGLDPKDFSSHSYRIGGATAMCAAGWSRSKIQQRGGWSELSDSDLIYALSLPSDTASGGNGNRQVTVDDIQWLQVFHSRSG